MKGIENWLCDRTGVRYGRFVIVQVELGPQEVVGSLREELSDDAGGIEGRSRRAVRLVGFLSADEQARKERVANALAALFERSGDQELS